MNKHAQHAVKEPEKAASQPAPEAILPTEKPEASLPAAQPQPTTRTSVATYSDDGLTGFEGATSTDYVVPLLDVLQAGSPEIVGNTIDNAKVGMLICRAISEVFDCNSEELIIIPVGRQHVMNEWNPRENKGGLVASHDPNAPAMLELKKKQPFGKIKMTSGTEMVETYYLFALLVRKDGSYQPVSIPFWSTKIAQYKAFMTKANGLTYEAAPGVRKGLPMFATKYRLTTFLKEKNSYKWWSYRDISFAGKTALEARLQPTDPLYQTARDFAIQVKDGRVRADMATQATDDDADAPAHANRAASPGGQAVGADGMPF